MLHRANRGGLAGLVMVGWTLLLPTQATVLNVEDFSTDPHWQDRDALELAASYASGFGNPGDSVQGTFASQGSPGFENDAFRLNGSENNGSMGAWAGGVNYNSLYTGFAAFTFDFYSEDVLPSVLTLRISDGSYIFTYGLNAQLTGPGAWSAISVPLAYSASWSGSGSATDFSNVFASVSFIDIAVTRNGTGEQSYYVDNFKLSGDAPTPPDGPSGAVPEASLLGSLFVGIGLLFVFLRENRNRLQQVLVREAVVFATPDQDNLFDAQVPVSPSDVYRTRVPQ